MDRKEINNAANAWAEQDPQRRAVYHVACETEDDGDPVLSMTVAGYNYLLLRDAIAETMCQCPNLYTLLKSAVEIYQQKKQQEEQQN
jgi:hypothetical protein